MAIDRTAREQHILDAAAKLVIRHGYNKITMTDVAEAVGLNRGLVYAHFKSKDDLLKALITREMMKYGERWIQHIETDPRGGTVAGIHRSILQALKETPFMAAIVTRDEHTFGKYLRKPGNIFDGLQTPRTTRDLLQAMQAAGAIRRGVNLTAMAYIIDTIGGGLVGLSDGLQPDPDLNFEEVMETLTEMYDRMLTPEDGGNLKAGKAVLRQFANQASAHFERVKRKAQR